MDGFAQPLRRALEDLDDFGLALMLLRPTVAADAVRDGVARAKGVLRNELGVYMAAWEAIGRALLSDAAAFAGWLSLDAARPGDARSYLTLARDAAREAGDATLHALAVASHALLLTNLKGAEPRAALWMLRQAGTQLPDDTPWEARAWLAVHTAKEYAAAGDRDGYRLHAEFAAAAGNASAGGESREGFFSPGGWFSDVDDEWFQDCTLRSLAHLTEPAAEPALRAALHQPGHPRREATLRETLAVCLARCGEPEQAAVAALGALDAAQGLPLWVDRVRGIRADLEPWADLPSVRELDDALVSA